MKRLYTGNTNMMCLCFSMARADSPSRTKTTLTAIHRSRRVCVHIRDMHYWLLSDVIYCVFVSLCLMLMSDVCDCFMSDIEEGFGAHG